MVVAKRTAHGLLGLLRALRDESSGIAFIEFAFIAPLFMILLLGGIEVSNYATTKMRMSQLALMIADHAARIGDGSDLAAKQVSETDINDVLTGSGVAAGKLSLYTRGRVIISELIPDPSNAGKYKINWQRCQGTLSKTSSYGNAGTGNLSGMGPTGQQVTATSDGTMFVEVWYTYRPIISTKYSGNTSMHEIAAMPVRDSRDNTQVYNTENATVHNCSNFTAT